MNFELRDYQREAALGVLSRLNQGRAVWESGGGNSSFALSAVTGSGKTVIATAVIEALLHGSADLDVEARPNTTFLWVTDDPALNRQTRDKMLQGSELLTPGQIRDVDTGYMDSELLPGRVYLLNIQKLSKNATLAKSGVDLRQHSFWEVIGNTITRGATDLVLVLDEAHRGMKRTADRSSIVRKIIDGQTGISRPVPVVWGISATISNFQKAMAETADRIRLVDVAVDTAKVRASGLLKDEIGVANPAEAGDFGTTLLREAVKDTADFEKRWAAYSESESEPLVLPVLVVQVRDHAERSDELNDIVTTIGRQWTESGMRSLDEHAIVHVFGDHEVIEVGGRQVRWVPPESIQGDTDIRVVLAKTAISTGWDCPRAEVLYSDRTAKDATHIAQIIGRMVRAPLTRRITTDDVLNSVSCYLPHFDRSGLAAIKDELEGRGKDVDLGVGTDVQTAPATFERNQSLDASVFDAVNRTLSLPAPDKLANPIKRAKSLAMYLADDAGPNGAMVADAGAELTASLNARLDGLAAEHKAKVAAQIEDLETASLERIIIRFRPDGTSYEEIVEVPIPTAMSDLERDVTRAVRRVREGVGTDFAKHRYDEASASDPDAEFFDAQLLTAALFRIPDVITEVEARCTQWVQGHLATFAAEIANTTGAARDRFRRVQEQTSDPEAVPVEVRRNERAGTADREGNPLPMYRGHLFADDAGDYPVSLNALETRVLEAERARPSFVAWYRNPSRPVPSAVRIAYQRDDGDWSSVQVDFVIVSRRDDGQLGISLVDPHGTFLSDGRAKLRALADYAGRFGGVAAGGQPERVSLVRVDAIADVDGTVRVLDLLDPAVRQAVLDFDGSDLAALYASQHARDFK